MSTLSLTTNIATIISSEIAKSNAMGFLPATSTLSTLHKKLHALCGKFFWVPPPKNQGKNPSSIQHIPWNTSLNPPPG
jgi:hypothetical protein